VPPSLVYCSPFVGPLDIHLCGCFILVVNGIVSESQVVGLAIVAKLVVDSVFIRDNAHSSSTDVFTALGRSLNGTSSGVEISLLATASLTATLDPESKRSHWTGSARSPGGHILRVTRRALTLVLVDMRVGLVTLHFAPTLTRTSFVAHITAHW
jgi:hypothetical protein